jgi:hydroxypyruvate reductase/glycerate 2-kinase
VSAVPNRRADAERIWRAGVDAVRPERCLPEGLAAAAARMPPLASFEHILVVGAGKAGAAMSQALEAALVHHGIDLGCVNGWVNVPDDTVVPLAAIHLHPARPTGINHPTDAAFQGTLAILDLVANAGPRDLLVCLISGGGSALLCAPVPGLTLADKQAVTRLLLASGASIQEMNAVRKHLSQVKGGGLARRFFERGARGRRLLSLLISDVIGDPLDVIASGPTCADPTTFADALAVLTKYQLTDHVPATALAYLQRGQAGREAETLKAEPCGENGAPLVFHEIIATNDRALAAAAAQAQALGFTVHNDGSTVAGDTAAYAAQITAQVRRLREGGLARPLCLLSGGETTVSLGPNPGEGGRNQEFVLALLTDLGEEDMRGVTALSGGTDGEDGPTDAAGAVADAALVGTARARGLDPWAALARHDAYPFFDAVGGLLKTGLTSTNVMDLRVVLLE